MIRQTKESKWEYRNVRWTRDGRYLAAAGDVLLVFDSKGNLFSKTQLDKHNLWGVSWNSRGDKIITSDQEGNIRITNKKGKVLKSFRQ